MNEQVEGQLTLFPEGFRASHSPLPGSDEAKRMTVTSGRKCLGLLENSNRNGLLGKMFLDLFEQHLKTYFPNLKKKDMNQGLTVAKLGISADCSEEKELLLWPRPTTGAPLCGGTGNFRQMEKLRDSKIITEEERKNLVCGSGGKSNPALMEWLMGFPIGWTDLDV